MFGRIIKTTGNAYTVLPLQDDGSCSGSERAVVCYVKGNFRQRDIRSTNPVAVGDIVAVEQLPDGINWITEVNDRKNYIVRRSTNLSKQSHILAANLTRAVLVVTLHHPSTSLVFIDRFLVTAEAYGIPAVLVFNKTDLLDQAGQEELNAVRRLYESLDYKTFAVSATNISDTDKDSLCNALLGKDDIVLLSGNSGVGKSTLLNSLCGGQWAKTGDISASHDKGMHTTTFSEMYLTPSGAWLIDTPGIKGFGVIDMQKTEVGHYFREIFRTGSQCRYSDCTHQGELGCAVVPAVEKHLIARSRYASYLSILTDINEDKYRR